MKFTVSKSNFLILGGLLAFVVIITAFFFNANPALHPQTNTIECDGSIVPFRANASSCLAVLLEPNEKTLTSVLQNPNVFRVEILLNPNGSSGEALAAYEISKTLQSVGISGQIVYTQPWPAQPEISVHDFESATLAGPIIRILPNQNETHVLIDGPRITVQGTDQAGLDAAACRVAVAILETKHTCTAT